MSGYKTGVDLLMQDYRARISEILGNPELTPISRQELLSELKTEYQRQFCEELRVMREQIYADQQHLRRQ